MILALILSNARIKVLQQKSRTHIQLVFGLSLAGVYFRARFSKHPCSVTFENFGSEPLSS